MSVVLVLSCTGCSSMLDVRSFLHPDADFSYYEKVGVIAFSSQDSDTLAGEKVTEHFVTELFINGELGVMDLGQFNAVVSRHAGNAPFLAPEHFVKIGEAAGVQGVFEGTVHEYRMVQLAGERYPILSMTVKLIDAATGTVVWQSNVTARGGPNLPIVSIGESYLLGELTQKVCKKVVKSLYKKAGVAGR